MYRAAFNIDDSPWQSALWQFPDYGPSGMAAVLLAEAVRIPISDLALRFRLRPQAEAVLAAAEPFADSSGLGELERLAEASPDRIQTMLSREQYDSAIAASSFCIRLDIDAYTFDRHPWAPDFSLRPVLPRALSLLPEGARLDYQINLCRSPDSREIERQARKHLAALDLDHSTPPSIRAVQRMIAGRFSAKQLYFADEFFLTDSRGALEAVKNACEEVFAATCKIAGFRECPMHVGEFGDEIGLGLHSCRLGETRHWLGLLASAMSVQEVLQLPAVAEAAISGRNKPAANGASVFISYCHRDFGRAWKAVDFLESCGIPCWIAPRDIGPGESYPEQIMRGIDRSRGLVIVFSEASNLSLHVQREVERALNRRLPIIPLRIENRQPTGAMDYLLATCHWVDGVDEEKFAASLPLLAHHLKNITPLAPPT